MKWKEAYIKMYCRLAIHTHDICTIVRAVKKGQLNIKDYPAVTVVCRKDSFIRVGHSNQCINGLHQSISYVAPLYNALKPFGDPPQVVKKQGDKDVYVGTCAEDAAANKVLECIYLKMKKYPPLKELEFTTPIRPRTLEKIEMCPTCMSIFNSTKIVKHVPLQKMKEICCL